MVDSKTITKFEGLFQSRIFMYRFMKKKIDFFFINRYTHESV